MFLSILHQPLHHPPLAFDDPNCHISITGTLEKRLANGHSILVLRLMK